MPENRSIGVLVPTLNCAGFVPEHLESMREWLDLADEVVVVDSHSNDGTIELLRAGLRHPRVKFLNHPPGLYQSWNFGIQQFQTKYIYISTVGDPITRDGLEHLIELAEKFQSDVVISKPAFINAAGEPLPDYRWPIDSVLDGLKIERPRPLSTAQQFYFAVTNRYGAILGSSAGNIYRTDCLKQRPFPTDFGTAGDAGWGIQNIFEVKMAVTPGRFSKFRFHEKPYSVLEYSVKDLSAKLLTLAQSVIANRGSSNPAVRRILEEIHWNELEQLLEFASIQQVRLTEYRLQKFPWILHPGAWLARANRNKAKWRINELTDRIMRGSRISI